MASATHPTGSPQARISRHATQHSAVHIDISSGEEEETESSQDELAIEQSQRQKQSKKRTLDQRSPQKQQQEVLAQDVLFQKAR